MELSVVIPVYNVESYVVRCVESVIAECQDISYEVLLVDDGSTDKSGNLCDELARKYEPVKVFHKPNGGLSDARNYGVARAKGEYVFYLDSDDYLVPGGLSAEMETAKISGSDVVCGNFYYSYCDYKTLYNSKKFKPKTLSGGEEAIRALLEGTDYENFAWGKIIRRKLALQYLFPKGKLFEDIYWFHLILHASNSVTVIDNPVVFYVQRPNSISFEYKLKSLDILDGYKERLDFLQSYYPHLADAQKKVMVDNCIQQAWMIVRKLKGKDFNKAKSKLRKVIADCGLLECNMLSSKQRNQLYLVEKNMYLYMLYQIVDKIF